MAVTVKHNKTSKKYKLINEAKVVYCTTKTYSFTATDAEEIYKYCLDNLYQDSIETYEEFYVLHLTKSFTLKNVHKMSQGSIDECLLDIRLLIKAVLDSLAVRVVLIHNHPSGNLKRSDSDVKLTSKVKEALKYFDIELTDHIIITKNSYYSFANEGTL